MIHDNFTVKAQIILVLRVLWFHAVHSIFSTMNLHASQLHSFSVFNVDFFLIKIKSDSRSCELWSSFSYSHLSEIRHQVIIVNNRNGTFVFWFNVWKELNDARCRFKTWNSTRDTFEENVGFIVNVEELFWIVVAVYTDRNNQFTFFECFFAYDACVSFLFFLLTNLLVFFQLFFIWKNLGVFWSCTSWFIFLLFILKFVFGYFGLCLFHFIAFLLGFSYILFFLLHYYIFNNFFFEFIWKILILTWAVGIWFDALYNIRGKQWIVSFQQRNLFFTTLEQLYCIFECLVHLR